MIVHTRPRKEKEQDERIARQLKDQLERALSDTEQLAWRVLLTAREFALLQPLLGPEFVFNEPNQGEVIDRVDYWAAGNFKAIPLYVEKAAAVPVPAPVPAPNPTPAPTPTPKGEPGKP